MTHAWRALAHRGVAAALFTLAAAVGAQAARAAPAQGTPDSQAMQVLQSAHWIAEGSVRPRHVLYVFVDANCPYCHKLWLALQPYYADGLQVRAVFVGIIGPTSPGKAAAILQARDPGAALRQNEQQWGSRSDGGGGMAPLARPSDADAAILSDDLGLMQAFGFQGTPGIIYFDGGGQGHGTDGLPPDTQLAQMVRTAVVPFPLSLSASPAPARRAAESPR